MRRSEHEPSGIALKLMYELGIGVTDAARLTWGDVDFETRVLRLRGEELDLSAGTLRVLKEERARRAPEDDPHVILSVNARKPIPPDRLSAMLRGALIDGGLEHVTPVDVREGRLREIDWRILRTQVEENGFITPGEAAQKLGVGVAAAWNRLQFLEKWGYLVHVGRKYYAADKTPPAERMRELLYKYISENGSIGCQEAAELLNIPYRQIGYLLRTMVKKGELSTVKRGRYELPSNALPEREEGPRSGG